MDWITHMDYWSTGLDPIVWLRVLRVMVFFITGLLMLREPMMCGGRNRLLHRMLAIFFIALSLYSYDIAKNRMTAIAVNGTATTTATLLFSESFLTLTSMFIMMKLGYDYTQWREYQKLKCSKECDKSCRNTI